MCFLLQIPVIVEIKKDDNKRAEAEPKQKTARQVNNELKLTLEQQNLQVHHYIWFVPSFNIFLKKQVIAIVKKLLQQLKWIVTLHTSLILIYLISYFLCFVQYF